MENKFKKQTIKSLFYAGSTFLFLIILTTCDNFMQDAANFKEDLKDEVIIASADDVEILIQAETGTGTTSPSGYYTGKVGVSFNISMQVDSDYGFIRWAAFSASDTSTELSGVVSFDSVTSPNTKASLLENRSDVIIRPICEERLYVTDKEPGGLYTEVVRNYPITVQFNKNVDPDSLTDSSILIEGKLNGSYDEYVSVKNKFDDPVVYGQYMTINVNTALTAGWRIRVTLDESISDTSGLTMTDDYDWQYLVSDSVDNSSPSISSVTGSTGTSPSDLDAPFSGSGANDHRIGNAGKNFYLAVSAVDDSGVQNLFIVEEQITDSAGNAVSNSFSPVVKLYPGADYSLFEPQTVNDGKIELSISVTDVNGNSSAASTYQVVLDTTPPSVTANESKISYAENGQYVSDTVHFTNTGLTDQGHSDLRSDQVFWRFSFDNAHSSVTKWFDSAVSTSVSLQDLGLSDGEDIPVYIQLADDQMNLTSWFPLASSGIDLESEAPQISAAEVGNAVKIGSEYYVGDSSATIHIVGTDSKSGVYYYYLSDKDIPPTGEDPRWNAISSPSASVDFNVSYSGITEGSNTLYLWLKDQAGNVSDRKAIGPFIMDTKGPVSLTAASTDDYFQIGDTYYTKNGSLVLKLGAADSGCGLAGFDTDGDLVADIGPAGAATFIAGNTYTVYAIDKLAHLSSSGLTISVVQDTTPPTCSSLSVSGNGGYNVHWNGTTYFFHSAAVSFTASDNSSGLDQYALSDISDSLSPSLVWKDYSGSVTENLPSMPSSGALFLHLKDKVGNISITHLVEDNADLGTEGRLWKSDITPPTVPVHATDSADYNPSGTDDFYTAGSSVAFTFDATDSESGVAGYDDSDAGTPLASLLLGPGTHTVYAYDNVGNVSASSYDLDVIQDNTAPDQPAITGFSPAIDYDDSANHYYTLSSDVRAISLDADDNPGGAGTAGYSFSPSGPAQAELTLTPQANPYDIYAIDHVGNASSPLSIILGQDTAVPEITGASLTATASGISDLAAADAGCGIDEGKYYASTGSYNGTNITGLSGMTADGSQTIIIRAYDYLGHFVEKTITRTFVLDTGTYTAVLND